MDSKVSTALSAVMVIVVVAGLVGCDTYEELLPERDAIYYPIGMEMHPNGRFLYVVNSNYDLRYRDDQGGTVSVIDTETGQIRGDSSPFLPSFGGHIELNADATRAYVTSRRHSEVTVLSVDEDGQALFCEDADGAPRADTRPCSVRRIPDVSRGARIPTDPFGIAVSQTERVVGEETREFDVVHLSHLVGRSVTSMTFADGDIAGASMQSGALMNQGGNQVAIRPGTEEVYVAGRNTNRVEGYRPFINDRGEVEAIVRGDSIRITERGENIDARGLAFDDSGDWMYVVTRRPNALHVVGMNQGAQATPQVVHSIALQNRPSELVAHRGPDGVKRLYVPSFRHGVVEVVDPDVEAVIAEIDVGRSPYTMAVDPGPVHCQAPGDRCQGYVTLFDANPDGPGRCDDETTQCGQVAVIDLDPDSETFHTVIDTFE